MSDQRELPLVVDLDGTLLLDDTLGVMGRRMVAERPILAAPASLQLLRGRSRLKYYLWRRFPLEPSDVRWNQPLVARLADEAAAGRRIMLATGAPGPLARRMAAEVPSIGEVIATAPDLNLTSHRKAAVLVRRFGWRGFVYAGNSRSDLAVWEAAAGAWVCDGLRGLADEAARCTTVLEVM